MRQLMPTVASNVVVGQEAVDLVLFRNPLAQLAGGQSRRLPVTERYGQKRSTVLFTKLVWYC